MGMLAVPVAQVSGHGSSHQVLQMLWTSTTPGGLFAGIIGLLWQYSDPVAAALQPQMTQSTNATSRVEVPTTIARTNARRTVNTTASTTAIETSEATPDSRELGNGAMAGIAIGATAAFILDLSGIIGLLRHHQVRRIEGTDQTHDLTGFLARVKRSRQGASTAVHEVEGDAKQSSAAHEIEGKAKQPAKADPMHVRVELEGDWRGHEVGDK